MFLSLAVILALMVLSGEPGGPAAAKSARFRVLPPNGLLIAILAEAVVVAVNGKFSPSTGELVLGVVLLAIGLSLNIVADQQFKQAGVDVCPFRRTPVLITSGPFRLSRNPMYLGLVAICASIAFLSGTPSSLCIALLYAVWVRNQFIIPEEYFLLDHFGSEYDEYARTVPRWVGPSSYRSRTTAVKSQSGS